MYEGQQSIKSAIDVIGTMRDKARPAGPWLWLSIRPMPRICKTLLCCLCFWVVAGGGVFHVDLNTDLFYIL